MTELTTVHYLGFFGTSLVLGGLFGFLLYKLAEASLRKQAQNDATELVDEAKSAAELKQIEINETTLEIETETWAKEENFFLKLEEAIEDLEALGEEKKQKLDNMYSLARLKSTQFEKETLQEEERVKQVEKAYFTRRDSLRSKTKDYSLTICNKMEISLDKAQAELEQQLETEFEKRCFKMIENKEEEYKEHSESLAKQILDRALNRFARAYSSERGIAPVYFETEQQKFILVDAKGDNVKTIQELTGCDIIIQDELPMIGVAGFDPVRRELTRRLLERLLKEKRPISVDFIRKNFENQKRELLQQIKHDGDQLAKELRLQNLHPEVRQMMGSLRFRYSYTQNQFFHCAEVGWLAGLIASELGSMPPLQARRSGLLHDLGKAMDHQLDGGHAVIGADFIKARGESPEVVHAVRAHHFDETPETNLAFTVIAADAISGARPGARRSTIESYNQKVNDLDEIARGFDGVNDCYVLNGGREIRVTVNGKKVDDLAALRLSKQIAAKIEEDLSYPGQIKVVIVRETYSFQYAHANN